MKVALFLLMISLIVEAQPPKPKPIVAEKIAQAEVYQKQHSACGPFLDSLPKKKSDRLRRILEREDLTKHEIDDEVEKWISNQDAETREKYDSFKRALKVRLLRLKLRHELKMKKLSDEAKKLDEKIQQIIEDKELTWAETVQEKNDLLRKSSQKVLKELGINPDVVPDDEDDEDKETEDPNEDYTNNHENGKYDYNQNNNGNDFDYNNENAPFGQENGMRKPGSRAGVISRPKPKPSNGRPRNDEFNNGEGDYEH